MIGIFCSSVPGTVRPGSSGKPVPGYELRLVDETGNVITRGDVGTLQVRGASAFFGYWRQREKTQSTLVGDWVTTGDRYRVDQDGFYWYEGRMDDMNKVGGEWGKHRSTVSSSETGRAATRLPRMILRSKTR